MAAHDRTPLIEAFATLVHADADTKDPLRTFLPFWLHGRALNPDVVVVLGPRGAGKTALFKLATDPRTSGRMRAFFERETIPDAIWFDAFSQDAQDAPGIPPHPEVGTLEAFGDSASDIALRAFWVAHLLRRLRTQVPDLEPLPPALESIVAAPINELAAWVPSAETSLGALFTALDGLEQELRGRGILVVALYDHLDRVAQFVPEVRRRYVRALLSLWLSLSSRYKQIRGKVFLRDDLFDAGELAFADATKLNSRSVSLTWDAEALFQIVARHVANVPDAFQAERARRLLAEVKDLEFRDRGEFGWVPGDMRGRVYKAFVARVAGVGIGQGVIRMPTVDWILDRLKDTQGRITPRAMLWFFGFAAEHAKTRRPGRSQALFSAPDLVASLKRTSKERANEILEEYGLVARLENLRGKEIPLTRDEVITALGKRRSIEPEGIPEQGEPVLREMVRIGVLREAEDGRIDVPDIYRYGFDITPDYATAWKDLLRGDEQAARAQFVREAPLFGDILRGLDIRWHSLVQEEIERGDYEAARTKCERAMAAAQSARDLQAELTLWKQLGHISGTYTNDYMRAKDEYAHALEIARRLHDSVQEGWTSLFVAFNALSSGELGEAMGVFAGALSGFKDLDDAEGLWFAYIGMSRVYRASGMLDGGMQACVEGLRIAIRARLPSREQNAWREISAIAEQTGRVDAAILSMAVAAHLNQRVGDQANVDLTAYIDDLGLRAGLTPTRVAALRQEALDAYARDKGHSLLVAAFPEVTIPPFD
ncbi:hypothetical protein [Polyangium mundeleinium]|uniref:Uncharacterized protein n=1 Tax=Polyangium mundeleinium TaxID=2995306 RepID=A0ABT5EKA6_9BACT|nr:hypothetical protein [Polyangium mundeleinium]MDC0742206.1 hypothetical protein [Polyangium mundeleinium]